MNNYVSTSLLFLRVFLGGCLLFHGVAKVMHGVSGVKSMLASQNLPEILAYGVFIGEILAPILIICGIFTRYCAVIILFLCGMILYLKHGENPFELAQTGGLAAEIVYLYIGISLALLISGSGKFALRKD